MTQGLSQATLDNLYELGYHNLNEYLEALSEEYGVTLYVVKALYNIYGECGLFDGIVSELEIHQGELELTLSHLDILVLFLFDGLVSSLEDYVYEGGC